MKKLTLEEWEKKYVVGPVERLNQKDTMLFNMSCDQELLKEAHLDLSTTNKEENN